MQRACFTREQCKFYSDELPEGGQKKSFIRAGTCLLQRRRCQKSHFAAAKPCLYRHIATISLSRGTNIQFPSRINFHYYLYLHLSSGQHNPPNKMVDLWGVAYVYIYIIQYEIKGMLHTSSCLQRWLRFLRA